MLVSFWGELFGEGFEDGGGFQAAAVFWIDGFAGEPGGEFFLVVGRVLGGGFVGKFQDLAAGVFPFFGGEVGGIGEFPAAGFDFGKGAHCVPWDLVEAFLEEISLGKGEHSSDRVLFDGGPNGSHGGATVDGIGGNFFFAADGDVGFQSAWVSIGFGRLSSGAFLDGEGPSLAFFT